MYEQDRMAEPMPEQEEYHFGTQLRAGANSVTLQLPPNPNHMDVVALAPNAPKSDQSCVMKDADDNVVLEWRVAAGSTEAQLSGNPHDIELFPDCQVLALTQETSYPISKSDSYTFTFTNGEGEERPMRIHVNSNPRGEDRGVVFIFMTPENDEPGRDELTMTLHINCSPEEFAKKD